MICCSSHAPSYHYHDYNNNLGFSKATKAKATNIVVMEVIIPPPMCDGIAYLFGCIWARNNEHKIRYCQQLTCRWLVGWLLACLLCKRMLLF
jgi:hypothetical protein